MCNVVKTFGVMSWNVRGLGDLVKCGVVRDAIMSANPCVTCLQETKLHDITKTSALSFLPPSLDSFQFIPAARSRVGILTA